MELFQSAAKSVVEGDLETLQTLSRENPGLLTQRSPNHGATLLHYVGANGPVEEEMQKTPPNAVEMARFLLANGCPADALINEEPATTPLVSLVTSEFPALAGVQAELVRVFLEAGAAVNGVNDDGYPLACALCFQYPDAIKALVDGGARIDNIVAAASFGQLDFVKNCFDQEGRLRKSAISAYPEPFMREFSAVELLETAIEHAEHFKQQEVLEYLKERLAQAKG